MKHLSDIRIRMPFGNKLKDLIFARGECGVPATLLQEITGDSWTEEGVTGGHRPHCGNQIRDAGALEEVPGRAGPNSPVYVLLGVVHREHQYACGGGFLSDPRCRLDAIKSRHRYIHYQHVWSELNGGSDRVVPVSGFPDHSDTGFFQQGAQPLPHHRMVISEHDSDRLRHQGDLYHRPRNADSETCSSVGAVLNLDSTTQQFCPLSNSVKPVPRGPLFAIKPAAVVFY